MKPVLQDRFRDLDGTDRGNCLQAALASVLELPLDEVPHFVQDQEDGGPHWLTALEEWLEPRGLTFIRSSYYEVGRVIGMASGTSPRDPDGGTQHIVVTKCRARSSTTRTQTEQGSLVSPWTGPGGASPLSTLRSSAAAPMPTDATKSQRLDWCTVDDCPATICGGPHVAHHCPNGDLVTSHIDNRTPCPGCGHVTHSGGPSDG